MGMQPFSLPLCYKALKWRQLSQKLTENNIAFAPSIAKLLAKNQHFWEELMNILYLLPEKKGKW